MGSDNTISGLYIAFYSPGGQCGSSPQWNLTIKNRYTMTIQSFLEKHKDFKLNASGNTITLEVNCNKRLQHITEVKLNDLRELGYVNLTAVILNIPDQTTMICGWAIFTKLNMSRSEKIDYLIQHSAAAEPPEFFVSWSMDDIDEAMSTLDKSIALGVGGEPDESVRPLIQHQQGVDVAERAQ